MASQTVLESIIDSVKPKKKRIITKRRVLSVLNIASRLLAVTLVSQPALAPLQGILEELLKPAPDNDPDHGQKIMARIRKLKAKMVGVSDIEQQVLKREIEALVGLLTDEA